MKLGSKDYFILALILIITLAIGLLNEPALRRLITYGIMLIVPTSLIGWCISWLFSSDHIREDVENPIE